MTAPAVASAQAPQPHGLGQRIDGDSANNDECLGEGVAEEEAAAAPARARYSFPQLPGEEFTLQQLVGMSLGHDARLSKIRRRDLPEEFWEARRRALNRQRTQRQKRTKRARHTGQAEQAEPPQHEEQQRAGGDEDPGVEVGGAPEGPAKRGPQRTEEERRQAVQAHLEQQARVQAALQGGLRVAVDCSHCPPDASGREVRSLAKQLQLCVGANKRAPAPLNLHFVGFAGPVREFAAGSMNALRWGAAHLEEAPALALFPRDQLVLLSPDAEEALTALDPSKVYVIGGLVDRSAQKHATASFAQQHGIACARLPISEHLQQAAAEQQQQQQQQHGPDDPRLAERSLAGEGHPQPQPAGHSATVPVPSSQPTAGLPCPGEHRLENRASEPAAVKAVPGGRDGLGPRPPGKREPKKEGSFILNVNDVFDILLALNAGEGWGAALRRAIPQRKQQRRFGPTSSSSAAGLAAAAGGGEAAAGGKEAAGQAEPAACTATKDQAL